MLARKKAPSKGHRKPGPRGLFLRGRLRHGLDSVKDSRTIYTDGCTVISVAGPSREHISVTEASARGVARLAADAAHGVEVVITRRGEPVAAVVSVERLDALDELRADLRDLALVIGRTAADDGRRLTLDDVRAAYSPRR